VDTNLTEHSQRLQNLLQISTIESLERRTVAGFLEDGEYEDVSHVYPELLAQLLLECLPAYVHSTGGQVIWGTRMDRHEGPGSVAQRTVTLGGRVRRMLHDGSLFLHLPNERIVVTSEPGMPRHSDVTLGVCSDRGSGPFFDRWHQYAREHNYLRGQTFFADGEIVEHERSYCWDDIYVSEETRRMVCTHVQGFLANYDRLKDLGVKTRRGLILAGPPGTGKTLLGKILADTLDVSFIWISPRHVKEASSFEAILRVARFVAPAVVFLEDLDLFAEERDSNGWTGLGELMNQLDGAVDNEGIVTIATTNRLDVIEKALRNRPGRFDRVVEMEAMDDACRRQMLRRQLRNARLSPVDMDHLVQATEDYTGAQVEELAHTVYILALARENASCRGETVHRFDDPQAEPEAGPNLFVDRHLIDSALGEMHVERKAKLGFHVA